jgi:hypothetical protein
VQSSDLIHIWRVDDWSNLYSTVYNLSDADWYVTDVESLTAEGQEFFVGASIGGGAKPRPTWDVDQSLHTPPHAPHMYVYANLMPRPDVTVHEFLRELNWLSTILEAEEGWGLVHCAVEITGAPSEVCILWAVTGKTPNGGEPAIPVRIEKMPRYLKFRNMFVTGQSVDFKWMYPEYTEFLQDYENKYPDRPPPFTIKGDEPDKRFEPAVNDIALFFTEGNKDRSCWVSHQKYTEIPLEDFDDQWTTSVLSSHRVGKSKGNERYYVCNLSLLLPPGVAPQAGGLKPPKAHATPRKRTAAGRGPVAGDLVIIPFESPTKAFIVPRAELAHLPALRETDVDATRLVEEDGAIVGNVPKPPNLIGISCCILNLRSLR